MANVLRAGAGESTPGEEKVLQALAALPNAWTVIANKILPISYENAYEIDFIVIAPNRIVLLDEKSFGGTITGSDEWWTLSHGKSYRSPFHKIEMNAKRLAGWLDTKVSGVPEKTRGHVPVIGGVVLSNETANASISDARAQRCLIRLDQAVEKLTWLNEDARRAGFDLRALHDRIRDSIYNDNRARRPKRPTRIDLYTVEDQIDERPGCRVFLARRDDGERRTLFLYAQSAPPEAVAHREYVALGLLQKTGVVPRIGDPFLWSDEQYLAVPVHLPDGIAIGARPMPTSRNTAIREIEALARRPCPEPRSLASFRPTSTRRRQSPQPSTRATSRTFTPPRKSRAWDRTDLPTPPPMSTALA